MSEWWRHAVIYQIYPRSFMDSNNDGTGDLPGIVDRLGYVQDLGVDAIWISPFFKSPMKDFGYDVSDYCQVDPLFGALEDFDALLEFGSDRSRDAIGDYTRGDRRLHMAYSFDLMGEDCSARPIKETMGRDPYFHVARRFRKSLERARPHVLACRRVQA